MVVSAGCSTTSDRDNSSRRKIERQHAIIIAERALAARKLPLPRAYQAEVTESEVIEEFVPPRTIYVATFRRGDREKQSRIYSVDINEQSGQVEGVDDFRTSPLGVNRS